MMKHSSGQARVCLSGQVHYLGKHGSIQAAAKYADLLKRWEAGGRKPLRQVENVEGLRQLVGLFAQWDAYLEDTGRYRKGGLETSQR
jgi:hypothetical protein